MPHVDFVNKSKFFHRLATVELFQKKPAEGITARDCNVLLHPDTELTVDVAAELDDTFAAAQTVTVTVTVSHNVADTVTAVDVIESTPELEFTPDEPTDIAEDGEQEFTATYEITDDDVTAGEITFSVTVRGTHCQTLTAEAEDTVTDEA